MNQLTREEEMQAYTDALGALAIAVARQLNAGRFATDLKELANKAHRAGHGPSAGLIDELARTIEVRLLGAQKH